jgi:hypothetical protein
MQRAGYNATNLKEDRQSISYIPSDSSITFLSSSFIDQADLEAR